MKKDWTGNYQSIFRTLGASNHVVAERQVDDYYATAPEAGEWLLKIEDFGNSMIWECASGENHLANVFKNHGYVVRTSDIIKRTPTTEVLDFLNCKTKFDGHIITNPPYKFAKEFVEKAIQLVTTGHKVCMFLKVQFLEGKTRKELFKKYPPQKIWVSSSRIMCAKNGDFNSLKVSGGSAVAYAWFVWEKGYNGQTIIDWFN